MADPQPMSVVTGEKLQMPKRPQPNLKKMKYSDWRHAKMSVRPFLFTTEQNQTAGVGMNGFRVPAAGVAAIGNARTARILIPAGMDFEGVKLTCVAYDSNRAAQNDFGIMIQEASSDMRIMNYPIHMLTMTGTGQMPFILPCTLLTLDGRILNITFTLYAAFVTDIYFTLGGIAYFHNRMGSLTSRPLEDWA